MSKKKIVFLAAGPSNLDRLRLGKESREIEAGLRAASLRQRFEFKPVVAVRTRDLQHALVAERPHIVHFAGHGTAGGELMVEDDAGYALPVAPDALAELFELCRSHVECVVLNACHSAIQAAAIARHIRYVVGSPNALGDEAAIHFSIGFYDALGEGRAYEEAYRFGRTQLRLNFPTLPVPELLVGPEAANPRPRPASLYRMAPRQLTELARQHVQALAQGLEDAETHYDLSSIYFWQARYDLAAQHLKKAIELDPSLADAYYLLALTGIRGRSLARLPLVDVQAIEGYVDAAIANDDSQARYHYLLALLKAGYYDRNHLRSRLPAAGELLARAQALAAEPGEIESLAAALPGLDPILSAMLRAVPA